MSKQAPPLWIYVEFHRPSPADPWEFMLALGTLATVVALTKSPPPLGIYVDARAFGFVLWLVLGLMFDTYNAGIYKTHTHT